MVFLKPIIEQLDLNPDTKKIAHTINSDADLLVFLQKHTARAHIAIAFEKYYGFEMVFLDNRNFDTAILKQFDTSTLAKHNILPYQYDTLTKTYHFAIYDFTQLEIQNDLQKAAWKERSNITFKFAPKEDIMNILQPLTPGMGKITTTKSTTEEFNAVNFVNGVINQALIMNASDAHIERVEDGVQLRFRVDGIMTGKKVITMSDTDAISSIFVRLKGVANMDISEKRKPQDGRIDDYEYAGRQYDLRVSTVSTILGEKAVLRIFDKSSNILTFQELGFEQRDEIKIRDLLHAQNGIILMAGATGSGKTTTLYTMINEVNSDEVNIYTIEDPVEKTLTGVNQIQIDPKSGIEYPSTLRALLRQDPDIIVVGEIRDAATAQLSIQASLTGHLVLSTVHANGAIDAISRLLDMGIEPYLLGASAQGFLSQRLVRRLCPHCKRKISKFKPHEEAWLKKISHTSLNPSDFYEAVGCGHCTKGYKGREAVVEMIKISELLREQLSNNAQIHIIEQVAKQEGFIPMEESGLIKAQKGITSLDEVIKKLS